MFQVFILACCILTNLIFYITRSDYLALFVAASFYLNMFYFITLLIPTNPGTAIFRVPEDREVPCLAPGERYYVRYPPVYPDLHNMFFMNSRTLTLGIGLIFSVDIIYTLIAFLAGLPLDIALFVISQSAIIIIFYYPCLQSRTLYRRVCNNIDRMKARLSRELPPWLISLLFMMGFLVVVFVFLTTIILLPGVTLNAFLSRSGLTQLAHMFLPLAVLAISQYFIIRYIHGISSREMAERLMDYREHSLQGLAREDLDPAPGVAGGVEHRYELTSMLLESRIYQIKRNSLFGAFPVYVVDLDFSVMMDTTTLTAIKGYIRKSSLIRWTGRYDSVYRDKNPGKNQG